VVPAPPVPAAHEASSIDDAGEVERRLREALSAHDGAAAVRWGERLVELKPKRARHRLLYGDALAAAGRPAEALEQYRLAATWAPKSRQVRNRLSRFAGQ
jgi:hypothetical protein